MAKVQKTDKEWREQLTAEQYQVLRQKGTELPFSGEYVMPKESGEYSCAACGAHLFSAKTQHESTAPGLIGWPSFAEAAEEGAVELRSDTSGGMVRSEVVCSSCGSHLGHLFDDNSSPSGKHYCINSISLAYQPELDNQAE